MGDMRPALEQALRALRAARVSALHPDSVSLYTDAITRAEAALAQEEQREQDARAEQIMSEIWAQPDQTYEYIAAKLAENMQKAIKNRARVSVEAVRSALEQEEQDQPDINWLKARPGIEQFIAGVGYDMTLTNESVRFEAREKVDVQQEQEELVTRRSALAALNHLSLHNGPGRLEEATKMLVNPPRREWRGLTDAEIDALLLTTSGSVIPFYRAMSRAVEAALKERNHG
jgi:hypothetical protein